MQFRLTSRSTAHRIARYYRIRALVIAILIGVSLLVDSIIAVRIWRLHHEATAGYASLIVTGVPIGTEVVAGGLVRGHTPASVRVPAGDQRIELNHAGYISSVRWMHGTAGQTLTLDEHLWRQRPDVQRLQPVFPGASITDATFLTDGQLVLTVTMPSADDRQFWLVDATGATHRLGPLDLHGAVAVSPDGTRLAVFAPEKGASGTTDRVGGTPRAVWTVETDGQHSERVYTLPTSAPGENLTDASWSPDGRRLLVVSKLPLSGGTAQSRLFMLDISSKPGSRHAHDLITIPADLVVGSIRWSPDGTWVALMAQTERVTSLVLVNTASGAFRYLADLGTRDTVALPFTPVDWTPDGRSMVYAALDPEQSSNTGWLVSSKPLSALFTFDTDTRTIHRVGTTEARSPAWRNPDQLLGLSRPKGNRGLLLRSFDPDGNGHDQTTLAINAGSTFAARWDVAHAQAIIATRDSTWGSATPTYWLVRFDHEAAR